jgi:hypothetical protein
MAQAVQGTPQEFWRPPSPVRSEDALSAVPMPNMAQACPRCSSEFLSGSQFCHSCGTRRPIAISETTKADAAAIANLWEQVVDGIHALIDAVRNVRFPSWLSCLHFHEIKQRVGLSTGSLVAFLIGLGCVGGALLVGLLTAKTLTDWQAIQFYRAEWLLAATAAFLAGILLKKRSAEEDRDN